VSRLVLYSRVSRASQDLAGQDAALQEWAGRNPQHIYSARSEKESTRDTRPEHQAILQELRRGALQGLVVTSLDRWGRTMAELVLFLQEATERNWTFISLKEAIDLSTPSGRLQTHILSAFAEFERDRIRERTIQGLATARARGKQLGRHRRNCDCKIHR